MWIPRLPISFFVGGLMGLFMGGIIGFFAGIIAWTVVYLIFG